MSQHLPKFHHAFNQQKLQDEPIEQYFGNGNLFEQQKLAGGKRLEPKTAKTDCLPSLFLWMDKNPVKQTKGFLFFLILLGVLLLSFIVRLSFGYAVGTGVLALVTVWFIRFVPFEVSDDIQHYLNNASVTWRALLEQIPPCNDWEEKGRTFVVTGILLQTGNLFFLQFLFPTILSSIITIASILMFATGMALLFGQKEYRFLSRALKLQALLFVLNMGICGFFFTTLYASVFPVAGFGFLICWSLAEYMNRFAEDEMDTEMEEEDIFI